MRKHPNSHREAKATAPVLDSTSAKGGFFCGAGFCYRFLSRWPHRTVLAWNFLPGTCSINKRQDGSAIRVSLRTEA